MKTVLLTAALATASPVALAQTPMGDRNTQPVATGQQADMAGDTVEGPLASEIETRVTKDSFGTELGSDTSSSAVEAVQRAYVQTMYKPIWTHDGVTSLQDVASNLFSYGLVSDDVIESDLENMVNQRFSDAGDPVSQAEADIALTGAWLRLAQAISGGLTDEGEAKTSKKAAASYGLLPELLVEAGQGNAADTLETLEPDMNQYDQLKQALQSYREIREEGGWLAIPEGDIVEAGETDPRVPAIRERLAAEGYEVENSIFTLVGNVVEQAAESNETSPASSSEHAFLDTDELKITPDPTRFDEKLAHAVEAFQTRHGIKEDGVIGPNTISAMNESVDSKIARIADTMERWRAFDGLDNRFIWANIPSYTAEGWDNGERKLAMRTIVGTASRQTPTFNDQVEYAVANPRWYAPVSIVRKDKLPKLQNDPGYAERGNYKVIDRSTGEEVSAWSVNWNDPASAEKYRLVQMSGEGNALGQLKIIFPNQYSVYLHGTPGEHLFDRAKRAFSSGCIRLEEPTRMARWIASEMPDTDAHKLDEAVSDQGLEKFNFEKEIPIHITYMTVTVDDDGRVNFWRDIYDRTDGIERVEKLAPLHDSDA
ncbi:L,D-transpeptidase family protein [Henriciella sp.]|uniref:L,D-transpeptidase family protein n=1 Tax=Henriciella sp. TaxID=1968823 RepID=UPI002611F313|nr:L,D-transpeptidase family protein [Henriciella sp.]